MTGRIIAIIGFIALLPGLLLFSEPVSASGSMPEGMFALYQQNRDEGIPNYITEDFIILSYSMILNETVTELEEKVLLPDFQSLVKALLPKLRTKDKKDKIDRANLNFMFVIESLLSGQDQSDAAPDSKMVSGELQKIWAAKSIADSALMLQKIDYSQFKARGKYTRSEALKQYFQAMRYAGTVLFPVKHSAATGISEEQADRLTGQALALAKLISGDDELKKAYQGFEEKLSWLFGPAEDLRLSDYIDLDKSTGKKPLSELRAALFDFAQNGRQPAIISGLVDKTRLEKGVTPRDVLTGWRFIPQRFTPDSAAFQQLIFDKVTVYKGKKEPFSKADIGDKPVKGFPLGLELMALLGSEEALNRLDATDERNYQGYTQAGGEAKKQLMRPSGMASDHWRLIEYWLNRGKGSQPDPARRLNTCLSFWTYQRYISLLYTKQSYTIAAKGINLDSGRKTAWLAPAPELYLYLQNQVQSLATHLNSVNLEKFRTILRTCRDISFKEIKGQALAKEDVEFLNSLDQRLLSLTGGQDKPVVVDVHTEPTSKLALEEAIGYPEVVTLDVGGQKARGALFTYYEFKHPMDDRLTDEKWQSILKSPKEHNALELSSGSTAWKCKD